MEQAGNWAPLRISKLHTKGPYPKGLSLHHTDDNGGKIIVVHNFHTKFCGTVNLSLSVSFYLKWLHTLNSQDSSIMTSSLLCSPRMGLPISEILRASSSSGVGCPGKDRRQQVIIFSLHAQNEDSEMRQTQAQIRDIRMEEKCFIFCTQIWVWILEEVFFFRWLLYLLTCNKVCCSSSRKMCPWNCCLWLSTLQWSHNSPSNGNCLQSQRSCHMIYQSQHAQKQPIARKRHEKLKLKLKSFRVPIKEEVVFMVPLKEGYRKIRVN